MLVLMTYLLEDKSWCEPSSRRAVTDTIGVAVEENGDESTRRERKSDKMYSETEKYDEESIEEGIIEEEFPLDEWEEVVDRKAPGADAPEDKGDE